MDFLDETLLKAKEIFNVACKKTGDMVNTGKQKLDIATLENKLSKEYEALGKIYYDAVKKGEQANGQEEIKNIDQIKVLIEQKREEILKNTSKKVCKNCGKAINQDSSFCSNCGAKFE